MKLEPKKERHASRKASVGGAAPAIDPGQVAPGPAGAHEEEKPVAVPFEEDENEDASEYRTVLSCRTKRGPA